MKKNLFILLLMNTSAFAQLPQKGDWLVGSDIASLKVPLGRNRTTLGEIALLGGKFISQRVVLGVSVPVSWLTTPALSTIPRTITYAYGLVPFARFYLTDTRLRPYLAVGAGYLVTQYKGEREVSHNGAMYNGNVGLAYFINRNVSIDAVANYSSQPYQARSSFSVSNDEQLNFLLRFQIFLGK